MKEAQIDSVRPSATGAVTLARTSPASRDMCGAVTATGFRSSYKFGNELSGMPH
jgi:hypothetical protein